MSEAPADGDLVPDPSAPTQPTKAVRAAGPPTLGGLPPWEFAPAPPTPQPEAERIVPRRTRRGWIVASVLAFLLCMSLGLGGWGWYAYVRTNDRLAVADGRVARFEAADAARERATDAARQRAAQTVSIPVDVMTGERCGSKRGRAVAAGVQVTLSRTDGTEIGTATVTNASFSFIGCDLSGTMSVRRGDLGADRYVVHSDGADDVTITRATLLSQGIRLTVD
jgi:hypothetical protein